MSTLLLRLAGPLQSWGVSSKFDTRDCGKEPSKSAIIGMVASALGRGRDDSVDDLCSLRFGVRVDQVGKVIRDYHTANHPNGDNRSFVTSRYYLADALFLVGLEGPDDLLRTIDDAIRSPMRPLFLGRRSCPPTGPISLGIRSTNLLDSLYEEEWLASEWYARKQESSVDLEILTDSEDGSGYTVRDIPVSFSQEHRRFVIRMAVRQPPAHKDNSRSNRMSEVSTDHDPFRNFNRC